MRSKDNPYKEVITAHFTMRNAELWFDQGINMRHASMVQLMEKEVPLCTYRVTEAEDQLRLNRYSSIIFSPVD